MIIMKFGGTSVEDAPSIERVVEIIRARLEPKPVVVVSAMGKTTRSLLEAAEASAAGSVKKSLSILARLESSASAEENRALVTLVGEGLRRDPKLISRLLHAIDDFELGAVLHGLSPILINCIVAERDVVNVVARLHEVCFEKVDPEVFE
jgi:aspartate kinase